MIDFAKHIVLLDTVREFSSKEFPKEIEAKQEIVFTQEDVENFIVSPLAGNRCIKVTIEYSDIPQEQSLEQMLSTVTDENRPELVDFGKPVGKEQI